MRPPLIIHRSPVLPAAAAMPPPPCCFLAHPSWSRLSGSASPATQAMGRQEAAAAEPPRRMGGEPDPRHSH